MKILFPTFAFASLLFPFAACSQDWSNTIVTDRPDFTESALVVPVGMTQLETGLTYSRLEGENTITVPETLIRYGINNWLEARVGTPTWNVSRRNSSTHTTFDDGYFGVKVGFERALSQYFDFSLIPAVTAPFGQEGPDTWNPELKACAATDLSDDFSFSTMSYIRSEGLEEEGRESIYQHTFSLGFSFSERFASFCEYVFETYHDAPFSQIAHLGITYLLTPDIQFDLHGGRTISGGYADPFIATGISLRF